MASSVTVGPCGHTHMVWSGTTGHRDVDPVLWRVVKSISASPTNDDAARQPVALEPGTTLRHDQSDWTLQGCAACEVVIAWDRFQILDGPHAGRCVEFRVIDPKGGSLVVPPQLQPVEGLPA
jgi:hypothetical protein